MQFYIPKDSLRFRIEKDLDTANPLEDVHELSLDIGEPHALDVGSQDKERKPLDYGSSHEDDDALAPSAFIVTHHNIQVQLPIHVNDNIVSNSYMVLCSNANSWMCHILSCWVLCCHILIFFGIYRLLYKSY